MTLDRFTPTARIFSGRLSAGFLFFFPVFFYSLLAPRVSAGSAIDTLGRYLSVFVTTIFPLILDEFTVDGSYKV